MPAFFMACRKHAPLRAAASDVEKRALRFFMGCAMTDNRFSPDSTPPDAASSNSPIDPIAPARLPASPLTYADDMIDCQTLKQQLELFQLWLGSEFRSGVSAEKLIDARTLFIDRLLQRLWYFYGFENISQTSLVAVGGHGRGALHPLSAIDVPVLRQPALSEEHSQRVGPFLTLLWDF